MENPYENLYDKLNTPFSYDEMCALLDEPKENLGSRAKQKKRWGNYMDLDFPYGKIIINKIYDEHEMLLLDRSSKFTDYIADLMISYLANCNETSPVLTYKDITECFYMVNSKYYKAKYNKREYFEKSQKDTKDLPDIKDYELQRGLLDMGHFFNISEKIIHQIIKNALKSLKNRSLILYQDTFKLYKKVYIKEKDTYITKTYTCDEQQRSIFLDLRNKTMKELGIKTLQQIVFLEKEKRELYYKSLRSKMKQCDELYNCTVYAQAFKIEYGEKGINYEYQRLLKTNKKLINNNMQYRLLTAKELKDVTSKEELVNNYISLN